MTKLNPMLVAGKGGAHSLSLKRANRHGLIAGATGTGKTVTLQLMAENFSREGISVFLTDIKGDVSGISMAGCKSHKNHKSFTARAKDLKITDYGYERNPVVFWDLFGDQGHPIRTTVQSMGPLLLARMMELNNTQEGVLGIVFRYAEDRCLPLASLNDLRRALTSALDNAKDLASRYGNITSQSIGTIQRELLALEAQGGDRFFGEPAFDILDLIDHDDESYGNINILAADKLMNSPKLYSAFLIWMLSELSNTLVEVGDPDTPILVLFFDEAHLMFEDASRALLSQLERAVRLIRSKGVGVYFVTQSPADIPEAIAGQLGNRVQHALRAFTPRDQKSVRAAAETFRANPSFCVTTAIGELKVGEALVSFIENDGSPSMVERTLIHPPRSRVGPITADEREVLMLTSPFMGKYDQVLTAPVYEPEVHRAEVITKPIKSPVAGLAQSIVTTEVRRIARGFLRKAWG